MSCIGALVRLRVSGLLSGDTCFNDFFKFEKTNKASQQLLTLQWSDGHIVDDNSEIVHFV